MNTDFHRTAHSGLEVNPGQAGLELPDHSDLETFHYNGIELSRGLQFQPDQRYYPRNDVRTPKTSIPWFRRKSTLLWIALALFIIVAVGIGTGLGAALSQKNRDNNENKIALIGATTQNTSTTTATATVQISTAGTTTIQLGITATTTIQVSTATPSSDCPGSNGTFYQGTTYEGAPDGLQYLKVCSSNFGTQKYKQNLAAFPMATFNDCIGVCHSINFWQNTRNMTGAIFNWSGQGEQNPGECWCVQAIDYTISVSSVPGNDGAYLQGTF